MNDKQFTQFILDIKEILGIEITGNRELKIWKDEFGHFEYEVANRMIDLCYAEEERSKKSMALLKKYQSRAMAHYKNHNKRMHQEEEYEHVQENCDWCGGKGFMTIMDTDLPYESTCRCLCNNGKRWLMFPKVGNGRLDGLKRQYANRYFNEKWYTPLKKSEFMAVYDLAKQYIGDLDSLRRIVGERS